MVLGFAILVAGGLLLEAGISGRSLRDVVLNLATANHRLKVDLPTASAIGSGEGSAPTGNDFLNSVLGETGGVKGKTPKGVIDSIVIPIAKKHGWRGNATTIAAANAVHGPTTTGGRSDHQGPPSKAWAGDFGTKSFPHGAADVEAFMQEVAQTFGFPSSKGLQTKRINGFQMQLIWQAPDHYDHGHVGLHKV